MAATSGCKAWAVGSYTAHGGTRTLILYWNGKRWKVQSSPNPGRFPRHDELFGVAATSPTNAWAVGYYYGHRKTEQTLIERWNGTAWKAQKSPNPGGSTSDNALVGVAATSSTDAWAVGDGVILHWNGTAWKAQKSPSPGIEPDLSSVAATSATNAWAVGSRGYRTLIEHWNGTVWKVQKSPSPGIEPGLSGVAATSAKNAWAVGGITDESGRPVRTVIEHWNGAVWKVEKSPNPEMSDLSSVAATSAKNAWAVGSYYHNSYLSHVLIEHWNGRAWKVQKSPNPGGPTHDNGLYGVAATRPTNAWAVGSSAHLGYRTLALHWNGTAWGP